MEIYFIHLVILITIYAILAISLQLSFGFSGLLNLGHIAFFGVGAYVSAILSLHGFSFIISFTLAVIASGVCGWGVSILTRKLKGDYLALVTLGFTFVVYTVFLNWKEVTNGPLGLPGIPRPEIFGIVFSDNFLFLLLALGLAILSYVFVHRLCYSPFGKALEATRDDELATESLGKNIRKLKTISFIISASLAGIAGILFASYITYIDPTSFTFINLLPLLLIVIIGGLGSLSGTVLATIMIILLPETLRFIGLSSSILGPTRQIIYVLILLLILYYKPRGFYGRLNLE